MSKFEISCAANAKMSLWSASKSAFRPRKGSPFHPCGAFSERQDKRARTHCVLRAGVHRKQKAHRQPLL
eukprot:2998696-Pleurochrysis_carterae.AAC.1